MDEQVLEDGSEEQKVKEPPLDEDKSKENEQSDVPANLGTVAGVVSLGNGGDAKKAADNVHETKGLEKDVTSAPEEASERGPGGSDQSGNGDCVKSDSSLPIEVKDGSDSKSKEQSQKELDTTGKQTTSDCTDPSADPDSMTKDQTDASKDPKPEASKVNEKDIDKSKGSVLAKEDNPSAQMKGKEGASKVESVKVSEGKAAAVGKSSKELGKEIGKGTKQEEKAATNVKENAKVADKPRSSDRPKAVSATDADASSREKAGGGSGGAGGGRSYSAQRSTSRGSGKRPEDEKITRSDDRSKTGRASVESKAPSSNRGGRDDRKTGTVIKKERDRRDRDPGPLEKTVQKSKERDRPLREPQRDRTDREKTVDRRRENERPGSRRLDDLQQRSKGREERMKEDEEKQKKDEEAKKIEMEKRKEEEKIKQEEDKKRQEEEQKIQEEEAARKKEEEEERHAREAHSEALERKETKKALRTKNLAASTNWPDEDSFVKLDSSLKKNTAFIRKLKMLSEQQRDALAKEFQGLNLTKYVGEGAIAFCEAKLKMADISCAVFLCSLFHQRYSEFSSQLLQGLQRVLPTPPSKKDEKDAKQPMVFDSRIRVELRFLAELVVNGIFTEKEGLSLLNNLLSSIMKGDKENHNNIAIIISFTKHCGEDFAGIMPRKHRLMAEKYGLEPVTSDVFSSQLKTAYRNLLKDHYSSLSKYLERQHKDIQNIERQNRRALQNKGELSEERRKKYEEKQTAYQKLLMNTSTFADLIDEDMPDLPVEELTQTEMEMMAIDMMTGDGPIGEFDWANSLWEDEDTRTFHENLINLRSMVPAILFKDADQNSSEKHGDKEAEKLDKLEDDIKALEIETDEAEAVEGEEQEMEMEEEVEEEEDNAGEEEAGPGQDGKAGEETITEEAEAADGDDDPEEGEQVSNATLKMLMDAFINGLPKCVNRDHIDKASVDFCLNFNTKHNRKKLAKALFNVPRVRLDLLPFYSRLVATLHVCMPDIAEDLNDRLRNDFRWHVRKKDQMMVESKIKVSRFIGELTKFKMFSKADTLQCLKSLIQDFRHHNIDMACALLESCGRFLFRTPDSHLKTKALLELMMRKKSKMHLNERHDTMIDNAFFYCNPPEVTKVERKVRPPMHEYIRKLVYKDLCKTTVERVLKQIRKLPWDNQEIRHYTVKCMSNVWNLKYNNLHCLANLLAGLVVYHDDAGIQVVDAIMEDVRIGMEINHPRYNQRRVSIVKFLGELYNYRMVESSVIFNTLYTLLRFGVTLEGDDSPLDPPEHLFRIRLVCTILDTCGQFFDRGSSKKKLDCFLIYFQQYVWYKRGLPAWSSETRPFPMDVDNAISDSLEVLRPKLHIFASLEEATKEVEQLEKDTIRKVSSLLPEVQLTIVQPPVTAQGQGLTPIMEGNEDQTPLSQVSSGVDSMSLNDEDDDMSDDEDRRGGRIVGSHSASNSQSQNTGEEQEEMYNDYGDDHEAMESAGENEEDDMVTVITGGPKLLPCSEDEDFTSAFDKMLSDNIQQRNAEVVKVTQLDIGVPLHIKARTPVIKPSIINPFQLSLSPDEDPGTVNFVLMTRKGNKQQFKEFEVPIGSELAANLKNREEAEKAEKQRMKELTLTINERQEEEDYEEMLASMQRPGISVPNSNKPRFYHPKGAPNSDQIFNAKGNRKW